MRGGYLAVQFEAWIVQRGSRRRLLATEFLLLSGALIVIYIERQFSADANGIPAHVEAEAVPIVI